MKCLNEEQDLTDKMPLDLAPPKMPNTVRVVSAKKQNSHLRSPMPSTLKILSERSSRFDKSTVTKAEPKFRLEESWDFEHKSSDDGSPKGSNLARIIQINMGQQAKNDRSPE